MMEDAVKIGRLVCSIKGRDSGIFYLIVGLEDENRVLLADGERRKVEKPKRKNIKHLKFFESTAGDIAEKARKNRRINNNDVRKELKNYRESLVPILNL